MYEHRKQPLAKPTIFFSRVLKNIFLAILVMIVCLIIGVTGYHYTEGSSWLDSLHPYSMILSVMGPVINIKTEAGKWFSSCYALFSGVVFITNIGLILAPAIHRLFHTLHLEEEN